MDSTVRGNVKDLIAKANEYRKATIRNLFAAIDVVKGKAIIPECKEIQVVAHNPMDLGFSSRDFNFFKDLYGRMKADAMERMNFAATAIQKQMQKEGRYNPLIKKDRDSASLGAAKCGALITAIENEETRRINSVQERRDRDRREYEEYLAAQKATRDAAKAEVRAKEQAKREAAAQRPKLENKVIGTDLEALAAVKVEMRKVGKFVAERKIKKAEAIELAGGEITLKNILEVGGGLLPDFRQIVVRKVGAVSQYIVLE